uniref:Uncharacterized protein n=1 Tax=Rhizophora mucronata TaxID=61149 RepID=A0A2P2QS24_RHIMU
MTLSEMPMINNSKWDLESKTNLEESLSGEAQLEFI